jgi:hypothetical protein
MVPFPPTFHTEEIVTNGNKAFTAEGKLAIPGLALGGEKSFGLQIAELMKFAATNVRGGVVPDSEATERALMFLPALLPAGIESGTR